MITLANPTDTKLRAEITRLADLNTAAKARIDEYRENGANASQVKNARNGINYRNENILELLEALK